MHPSGHQLYGGVNAGSFVQDVAISTGFVTELNPVVYVPAGPINPREILIYRVQ